MTLEYLQTVKRDEILEAASRRGARNVRVFGSVARSQAGPENDVDFLVDLDAGRNLFDLGGLLEDLREMLGTSVDVVDARSLNPRIRDRVLAEAEPLERPSA